MFKQMFNLRKVLIFGGTGSWGKELTSQILLQHPKQIIIFSRGEFLQVEMERLFNNPKITFVIGDVRDKLAVDQVYAQYKPEYVFYLAALKHVPVCENMPKEAVKTNILGAINAIQGAINHKVWKFIDVSTDKAVNPANLYGLTKAIGEKMTIQANCQTNDTNFIVIRGGNVLGTNGSLVPYVINQISQKKKVKITNPDMTRFFLTLPQAINLLLYAAWRGNGGETYVMNMPSFRIGDVVGTLILAYGGYNKNIECIGAREGEKIHEELISNIEASRTFEVNENFLVIYPEIKTNRTYDDSLKKYNFSLSSEDNLRDNKFLYELLKSGGFLP